MDPTNPGVSAPTLTAAGKRVREEYLAACERLARASETLRTAQTDYDCALQAYTYAFGTARALGVA
jgi:hypothetical protein